MTAYAMRVQSGAVVAGPHVRDACARHLRDLEHGPDRGLVWNPVRPGKDERQAQWAIGFFRDVLKLSGGELDKKPFRLHEAQEFIVGSLWGWRRKDGTRRFRTAFIETGKGSGKSPLAAGLGILCTVADDEPGAETYAAAVDKDQAGILFKDAVAMAKMSDEISARVTFSGGEGREYNMAFLSTGSFFRPISSESSGRGKSGYRPHCVLLDEIHEHPTNAMIEFMKAGIKNRRQPLIFMITNSGFDRTSVCYDYHVYGSRVAVGDVQDDEFFAYICALDENEDPFKDPIDPELGYPKSWLKANPLLGTTIKPSYLEGQVREARGMPSKESIVRRLNFCEWVDAESPWIEGDLWRACEVGGLEPPTDRPHFLGLDLAGKRDMTAAARVVVADDGALEAEVRFWTPKDTLLERATKDRVPYDAWVRDGHLIAVDGRELDYAFVVRDLADWMNADGAEMAFDKYKIGDFTKALREQGVGYWEYEGPDKLQRYGLKMVSHGQGLKDGALSQHVLWMESSISALENLVVNRRLRVRQNPVLTFNSASAVLTQSAEGYRMWDKRKATGRIDGLVALCMAVGLAKSGSERRVSAYEQHGVRTV